MPFSSRIQPIDISPVNELTRESAKHATKSRLKRLFERHSRTSSVEKIAEVQETHCNGDVSTEFEPSSICLAKMVLNFVEDEDKPTAGKNVCNRFNGSFSNSSDDEFNSFYGSNGDECEILKSLVPCASICERNVLADTSKIVAKNKIAERKDHHCGEIVRDGLCNLGYDAAICKSRWEKSPSYPAGEYEYVDVIIGSDRLIIDTDFRSEFEIARSTKAYKAILQTLPLLFVGKPDRLLKIITLVSEAAKQSLKKKGMHFPPWRKAGYLQSKWLSPYTRITPCLVQTPPPCLAKTDPYKSDKKSPTKLTLISPKGFKESYSCSEADEDDCVFTLSYSSGEEDKAKVSRLVSPEMTKSPRNSQIPVKAATGFVPVISGSKP